MVVTYLKSSLSFFIFYFLQTVLKNRKILILHYTDFCPIRHIHVSFGLCGFDLGFHRGQVKLVISKQQKIILEQLLPKCHYQHDNHFLIWVFLVLHSETENHTHGQVLHQHSNPDKFSCLSTTRNLHFQSPRLSEDPRGVRGRKQREM